MVDEQRLLGSVKEVLEEINFKILGMSVRKNTVRLHMVYEDQAKAFARALKRGNFEEVTLREETFGFVLTADFIQARMEEI